jgi:tetratricopeptide (TPR) repeat protein
MVQWGVISLIAGSLLLTGLMWWLQRAMQPRVRPSLVARHAPALPPALQAPLTRAATAPPQEAIQLYRQLTHLPARTAEEKYAVGYAHYQIGKLYAEQKQFRMAQQAFRQLAEQRIATPALPIDPSFGTWSEQGAYQAAICAYQLNPQQGIQQMIRFIEEHPNSPLVIGAYKRILRWTNEKPPAAAQRAWEKAQAAHQERLKRAAACGPKALAYLLTHEFALPTDWQTLMKECGTGIDGTSLWALAQAARKRGFSAVGLEVSREGLLQQEPPFIVWNPLGHYVAVIAREGKWQVYDPEKGSLQPWLETALPDGWRGAILLLRPRQTQYAENGGTKR